MVENIMWKDFTANNTQKYIDVQPSLDEYMDIWIYGWIYVYMDR